MHIPSRNEDVQQRFIDKGEKSFDKYNKIWEKVSNIIKKQQ